MWIGFSLISAVELTYWIFKAMTQSCVVSRDSGKVNKQTPVSGVEGSSRDDSCQRSEVISKSERDPTSSKTGRKEIGEKDRVNSRVGDIFGQNAIFE